MNSDILIVSEKFRVVYTEGSSQGDDHKFYSSLYKNYYGKNRLGAIFIGLGSCNSVIQCVQLLDRKENPAHDLIAGLIDQDAIKEKEFPHLYCLDRYCHENFVYDPIIIYFVLKEKILDKKRKRKTRKVFKEKH